MNLTESFSKAFNKVCHKEIIHKLKRNGISGKSLKLLTNFLKNGKQIADFNVQCSFWASVNAGVPQGYIIGPPLLLIYINDLSDNLHCNPKLFADDMITIFCNRKG